MRKRLYGAVAAGCIAAGCATTTEMRKSEALNVGKAMAAALARRGEWVEALAAVDQLHREAPGDPEILTLRGRLYREHGMKADAEADLVEAIRLRTRYAPAHDALAVLYDSTGQPEKAIAEHDRALDLDPENAAFLNNKAFSLFARGRAREAIPLLVKAVGLDGTNPRYRNNLGFAYARTGHFPQAAEQFALGGSPSEAKNNLGYAYEREGNLSQAFNMYIEAVRLDPNSMKARHNLVYLAGQLKRAVPSDLAREEGANPP